MIDIKLLDEMYHTIRKQQQQLALIVDELSKMLPPVYETIRNEDWRQYQAADTALGIQPYHREHFPPPRSTRFFNTTLDRGSGFLQVCLEYTLEERGTMVCIWSGFYKVWDETNASDEEICFRLSTSEEERFQDEIASDPATWEIDYD